MIRVNNDEFCLQCMEWREYDQKGCCVYCGTFIKRKQDVQEKKDMQISEFDDFELQSDNTYERNED